MVNYLTSDHLTGFENYKVSTREFTTYPDKCDCLFFVFSYFEYSIFLITKKKNHTERWLRLHCLFGFLELWSYNYYLKIVLRVLF